MKSPRVKWLVGVLIIEVAGATGWLIGHASGPWHVELSSNVLGLCGVISGIGMAVVLCLFAKGREEARERNRHYIAMIDNHLRPAFNLSSIKSRRTSEGVGNKDLGKGEDPVGRLTQGPDPEQPSRWRRAVRWPLGKDLAKPVGRDA